MESNSKSNRTAAKSSKPQRLFAAKAARKGVDQSRSDLSDSRATSSSTLSGQTDHESLVSDSDPRPRHPNPQNQALVGVIRHPRRPTIVAKGARKVTFETPEDNSGSDDATLRGDPSPRRTAQGLPPPVHSEFPLPIERRVNQVKKSPRRGGLQQAAMNSSDNLPAKTPRVLDLERNSRTSWKGRLTREHIEGERRRSRMSIGSARRPRSSRSPDATMHKESQSYLQHGTVLSLAVDGIVSDHNEDLYEPPRQYIAKAARKQVGRKSRPRVARQSSPDNGDVGEPELPPSSDSEDESLSQPTKPPEFLLNILESISSATAQVQKVQQLPFLHRNLQKGFLYSCHRAGVDIRHHPSPQSSISVVYSYQPAARDVPALTAKSFMKDWMCPFCNLYRKFPNSTVLNKHLSWDHPSIEVVWNQDHTTVLLKIHDPEPEFPVRVISQLPVREPSVMDSTATVASHDNVPKAEDDQKTSSIFSSTPSVESRGSKSSTPLISASELKHAAAKYSNEAVIGSGSRNTSVSGGAVSQSQSGGNAHTGLAPLASFPFLPETSESGIVHYSCRPGGPRLFDILNTQSLKPFGVLQWVILDREEELFELDDILDEDKVMQALWFRWIFLNRNRFVANYFDGTKAFIMENLQLIKQGAGLLALRTWLLVLVINKFLLAAEVATLMKYYQELAGTMV